MNRTRLEAFSDGVIAIIITIMVLEMKVPHGVGWTVLRPLVPIFLTYVMSFVYVGIYWSNHHHMLHLVDQVDGKILWANLHLLFWLSLIPFASGWLGENHLAPLPTALYGLILLMSGVAYVVLQQAIVRKQGPDSKLQKAIGKDVKGKISLVLYLIAIGVSSVNQWIPFALYILVALMWFVPDRRIERRM